MKIAISNGKDPKNDEYLKLRYNFAVDDNYDFDGNGSIDVTSIKELLLFYQFFRFDYKNFRKSLMIYAATVGFDALDDADKRTCAEHFAVGTAERNSVYTIEEQIIFGKEFHRKSTECREERLKRCVTECYNRLKKNEADEIIDDLTAKASPDLILAYINFGREGTDSGDPEGIYDYVQAKAGTQFEADGLARKPFSPIGLSMDELARKLIDILSGNIQ